MYTTGNLITVLNITWCSSNQYDNIRIDKIYLGLQKLDIQNKVWSLVTESWETSWDVFTSEKQIFVGGGGGKGPATDMCEIVTSFL